MALTHSIPFWNNYLKYLPPLIPAFKLGTKSLARLIPRGRSPPLKSPWLVGVYCVTFVRHPHLTPYFPVITLMCSNVFDVFDLSSYIPSISSWYSSSCIPLLWYSSSCIPPFLVLLFLLLHFLHFLYHLEVSSSHTIKRTPPSPSSFIS